MEGVKYSIFYGENAYPFDIFGYIEFVDMNAMVHNH